MVSQKNLKIYDDEKRKGRPFPCKEDKSFKHKENNKRISTVYNLLENNQDLGEKKKKEKGKEKPWCWDIICVNSNLRPEYFIFDSEFFEP